MVSEPHTNDRAMRVARISTACVEIVDVEAMSLRGFFYASDTWRLSVRVVSSSVG